MARRADFRLAEGIDHLNNGSFGATPIKVLEAQDVWRRRLEENPSGFFFDTYPAAIRQAAARVAQAFGGAGEDWAFVENATAGVNAVVASLPWQPGDEVLITSQVYGAVHQTLRHHVERRGGQIVILPVPVPFEDAEALAEGAARLITPRTRLAVIDHVTSTGATILPVARLAAVCRSAGVPLLIDGAHALGMLPGDVPSIGADWYVGNLHKWCFAAKGCAVLWAAPGRRQMLHPTVISHDYGRGFPAEFDWVGTRDPSAWLSSGAALDYLDGIGADACRAHNNVLAADMAAMLARRWGTAISAAPAWRAAMATIRLPRHGAADRAGARALTIALLREHRVMAPVMPLDGAFWLRISAHAYNAPEDYERLAAIGREL